MTNNETLPRSDPHELALQLANNMGEAPEQVVARAEAYLAFLNGETAKEACKRG